MVNIDKADIKREVLDMDVLFVGAGPASLAGAIHLSNLIKRYNERLARGEESGSQLDLTIGVIEKGARIGHHSLSGAVLDPIALRELFPDFESQGVPLEGPVEEDHFVYLTKRGKITSPMTPPPLKNHGYHVVSLNKLVRWLGEKAEQAGVSVFPEFPGSEILYDGDTVTGVRTADKGVDKQGKPKPNFEPGVDIHAKVTVLGEGVRGSLAKQLIRKLRLDEGRNPQVYAIGVKEIWQMPKGSVMPGVVWHTMGFPLRIETYGGGFIYTMKDDLIDIGFVVGLDYRDPFTDGHREFQKYKTHPWVASLLKGGKMVGYGAKAIPLGGYFSMPRLYADGVLLVGDVGALLNTMRLKGIHIAMKSGMLAAETIVDALCKKDFSSQQLSSYENRLRQSWAGQELFRVRNFHQAFKYGRWAGLFNAGLMLVTGGRGWGVVDKLHAEAGHERMTRVEEYYGKQVEPEAMMFDGELTVDKLSDVYLSGTKHEEDQPSHLVVADLDVCHHRCTIEYGNPCQYFCPANVYEMVPREDGEGKRLQINASNCVHCKTCDIMDPYEIITWVTPEGGGGPVYTNL
ncbi:MAG: electron transfer flavoprotein-ubiquinone oxidoreductase [Bacteroidota bacterium]